MNTENDPISNILAINRKVTGKSFKGTVLEIGTPLNEHQLEIAQNLGATVFQPFDEEQFTTTLLFSDIVVMDTLPGVHSSDEFTRYVMNQLFDLGQS